MPKRKKLKIETSDEEVETAFEETEDGERSGLDLPNEEEEEDKTGGESSLSMDVTSEEEEDDASGDESKDEEDAEESEEDHDLGKPPVGFVVSDCVEVGRNQKGKMEVKCTLCELKMLKGSFWRHRRYHDLKLKCDKCSFRTDSEAKLEDHAEKHVNCITCDVGDCGKEFQFRTDFLRHYQSVHNKLPDQRSCGFCNKAFRDKNSLDTHLLSHEDWRHKCTECGKAYKTLSSLKIHQVSHSGEYRFQCTICDKKFSRKDKFKIHVDRHDPFKPRDREVMICPHVEAVYSNPVDLQRCSTCGLICNSCGMIFGTRKLSRHHTHNNLCQTCGWKSPTNKAHHSHVRFHFVAPEFRCQDSKFGFIAQHHFDLHNYKEHGIPIPNRKLEVAKNNANLEWECKICKKTYATKECLAIHSKHHQEKKFKCYLSSCGKEFITSTLLDQHVSGHIKDTPHKCSECGKTFVRKTDLNRHKKTHDRNPTMIDCTLCDMKLKSDRNLKLHLQYHKSRADAKQDHKCKICRKVFLRKSHLKTHQRDIHGLVPEAKSKAPVVRLTRRAGAATALTARIRGELNEDDFQQNTSSNESNVESDPESSDSETSPDKISPSPRKKSKESSDSETSPDKISPSPRKKSKESSDSETSRDKIAPPSRKKSKDPMKKSRKKKIC